MKFKKFVQTESHYLEDSDEIETNGYYEQVDVPESQVLNELTEIIVNDYFDGEEDLKGTISCLINDIGIETVAESYEEILAEKFI